LEASPPAPLTGGKAGKNGRKRKQKKRVGSRLGKQVAMGPLAKEVRDGGNRPSSGPVFLMGLPGGSGQGNY